MKSEHKLSRVISQRSYHLTPSSRLQFGCYNKEQTSDNILPFRPEITWVMATFCIAADRSKFHLIPVSLWDLKCGPRDSIGPRKIKCPKLCTPYYSFHERSQGQDYAFLERLFIVHLYILKNIFFFCSETFLCLLCLVPSNPANLQTVLLKSLTVVLCYFFHNVKFVKHWSSTSTWGLCKRKM